MSKTVRNRGFPGSSDDEVSACNVGDLGSIPESGRSPGEGNGNPLQYSCLENSMRSLVGYSPWDLKELDMAEQLTLSLHVLIKAVHYPEQYFHIPMRKEVIQSGK